MGLVGYWNITHEGRDAFECAYGILPEFQGRGLAAAAMQACLAHAALHGTRDDVYAYPKVTNGPSNALCERLGFVLEGEQDFEYPKGHPIRANAWRYALGPPRRGHVLRNRVGDLTVSRRSPHLRRPRRAGARRFGTRRAGCNVRAESRTARDNRDCPERRLPCRRGSRVCADPCQRAAVHRLRADHSSAQT